MNPAPGMPGRQRNVWVTVIISILAILAALAAAANDLRRNLVFLLK